MALSIIILLALMVVKLGSSALQLTGMSKAVALFQAASAFFGVGFTTKEAEQVVSHPVRRRIILHLIVAGNVGLTSALATLLVTFIQSGERGIGGTFAWLGITAIVVLTIGVFLNLHFVRDPIDRFVRFTLLKSGLRKVVDYDYLLNLRDGYCVFDGEIGDDHPWIGMALCKVRPADQGVIVLGIYRSDGEFIGAPNKDSVVLKGDVLMVYGRDEVVRKVLDA
ncbi:TrkA C-terminal domain-containing protein [Verrucomicrobiaceae bacterium 227]